MNLKAICRVRLLLSILIVGSFFLCFAGKLFADQPSPTEPSEIYHNAQSLFDNKKYDEAILLYRDVIVYHHVVSAEAHLMIGQCYFELEKYAQARQWFEELVTNFPQVAENMQAELKKYWGASFFHENLWAEALEKFTGLGIPGAGNIPPMEQPWYDMVGRCYEQLGDIEKSLEAYNPQLYTALAYIPKQNASSIRRHYWQIADTKKELRELALYRIAESYLYENRYEDAIHVLQRALNTNFYKDGALLIGRCYFEWGKYKQMTDWIEDRLTLYAHPQPIFFYYLALGYYYQHNYELVLKILTRIAEHFPEVGIPIECQYRIADSLFELGRYSEAAEEYDKITRLYIRSNRNRIVQARHRLEICNAKK